MANLGGSLPADVDEAVDLRPAVPYLDLLLARSRGHNRATRGARPGVDQRAAEFAHAGSLVHRHRDFGDGCAGTWSRSWHDSRAVPQHLRELGIASALGAAGLLHLSLPLP